MSKFGVFNYFSVKLAHSQELLRAKQSKQLHVSETNARADGREVNPGRRGTEGAIHRPVHCLWEVKSLLFKKNYAPTYKSKARTENREKEIKTAD